MCTEEMVSPGVPLAKPTDDDLMEEELEQDR
jgi:hypothetical protein